MSIPRGTTPTFQLTFPETVDLTTAANVYVTFTCGSNVVTKTGDDLDVEAHSVSVYLTQAETFLFDVGKIKIQANWTDDYGGRVASEVVTYLVSEQLLNRVVV